jgi:ribosomal protein S20
MKSLVRSLRDAVKAGKKDEAEKLLPAVQKAIDTAAKKHLMHWRTAARKKSAAAKLLA